ncbi:MAG: DNA polymerase III subunit delta [Pelagibacteraceae bacterium]|nr:DNA polymerase III subunit delta [Pelagibacteraceae bacterium]
MIQKAFEIDKINFNKYNLYLFYGENEGYKNEIIKNKFEKLYPNKIYRYDEKEVLEKKDEFFNSILTKSFFENDKLIIISRTTDKIKDIIEDIFLKKIDDIKIILSANILEKKSKLRNYFEKNKDTICVPFYADTYQTLSFIAVNFFKEKKISISQETINLIAERCKGNRENLNNELKKIENYAKSEKRISVEDILKLSNLAENYNASELTDNCLAKNIKKTANILNENNYSNEDCILIVRTLLTKAKRIVKLQEELKKNKNIEQVITNFKPPIFWKDKTIVKQQINHWPLEKINNMIENINETELLIKKNSANSLNILSNFIISQSITSNN